MGSRGALVLLPFVWGEDAERAMVGERLMEFGVRWKVAEECVCRQWPLLEMEKEMGEGKRNKQRGSRQKEYIN